MIKEINSLKPKLAEKENKAYVYFKTVTKILSNFDVATEEMVTTLHNKCDEQVHW